MPPKGVGGWGGQQILAERACNAERVATPNTPKFDQGTLSNHCLRRD
jgi:hypothetical protein